MREEKKQNKAKNMKKAVIQGIFLQLGMYIIVVLFLAIAISKEVLQEGNSLLLLYITTAVAAWCGGKLISKRLGPKMNLYAIVPALCFSLICMATAIWVCDGEISTERTMIFMLCTLAGGVLSIRFSKNKKRRGKRLLSRSL